MEFLKSRINELALLLGVKGVSYPVDVKEASEFNFNKSDCILIKGDNLPALSWMAKCNNEVDFCYIDPPYNTGQEFIFSDNRKGISTGIWGKHHDWLAFMLPRLSLAHTLLKQSGVIAISIDDYEYAQLKVLMDSIFGEENYISTIVVARSKNGKGSKQHVAVNHEYVLIYGRSNRAQIAGLLEDDSKEYEKADEHGEFTLDGLFRKKGDASLREDRPNMYYPLFYSKDGKVFTEKVSDDLCEAWPVDSKGIARRWLWGREKASSESWRLYASPKGVIYVKNYKTVGKRIKPRSIWDSSEYLTDRATIELKNLFGEKVFETPKPISLLRDLIDCFASQDATVLDFFAGTGTTAEAVWMLNKRDTVKRKVILVEQNLPIRSDHVAGKNGFACTSDLTEFRLKSICDRDPDFSYSSLMLESKATHTLEARSDFIIGLQQQAA